MKRKPTKFFFPRQVLVMEIERRCFFPDCPARNLISLTKSEAIEYRGFTCTKCERWNEDELSPESLPGSWQHVDSSEKT